MRELSSDQVQSYVESLKAEVQKLEVWLQDGANRDDLSMAGKRIVLCATLMDEAISRGCSETDSSF
jgi:hypothetical protein